MASIRERRRRDGTKAFAVLWRDPDTGRQTSLTYDDLRDATVARQLIEAAGGHAVEAARIADAVRHRGPTVDDVISEHIDLLTSVGPDTRAHYRQQLAAHISPVLGPYPVASITYRHVAGWVRTMSDSGLAPKTIANVHGLFSAAMTTAVRLGYRDGQPVCRRRAAQVAGDARRDDGADARRVRAAAVEGVAATTSRSSCCSSRPGCAGARRPRSPSPTSTSRRRPPTLRVTKAWKRDEDRHWYVGPPKTERARRTVSLPDDLVDVLGAVSRRQGSGRSRVHEHRRVSSCRRRGSGRRRGRRRSRPRLRPLRADGTPDPDAPRLTKRPRVHDLRHTHASWMIAAGVDLFVLQRRLGHESITTTTETYAHLLPDQQAAAAAAAGRALGGLTTAPGRA